MQRDPSLIPLSHDHHHALSLCVLTKRSLAADGSPDNVAVQAAEIIQKFDSDLRRHFDIEEQVLFPVLATFDDLRELVAELLMEHHQLSDHVDSLRSNSDRLVMEDFCRILQQHVRKEESQLFEAAQRLLTREQLDDLGRRLAPQSGPVCFRADSQP